MPDLAEADIEYRRSRYRIELECRPQRGDGGKKLFGEFPTPGFQRFKDLFSEYVHEFFERPGGVNVDKESVVTVFYLRLGVTVVYQPGLAHTAG